MPLNFSFELPLKGQKTKVQIYWAFNDEPGIILRVLCLLMHSASSAAVWRGHPCYPGITEKGYDTQSSWAICLRFSGTKNEIWEPREQAHRQDIILPLGVCVCFFFFKIFKTHMGWPYYVPHLKEELCTWAFSSPCFFLVWCMQHCMLELRGRSCLPLYTARQIFVKGRIHFHLL